MPIWCIRYQDSQGRVCKCLGERETCPTWHEAMEIVIQHLIITTRGAAKDELYFTALSTQAISTIKIVSIALWTHTS